MALTNQNESRNFSATSIINDKSVMYMNANYNTSTGELSFNNTIRDMETYKANKTVVDGDYDSFKDDVESKVIG